jgi:hypothetical protein
VVACGAASAASISPVLTININRFSAYRDSRGEAFFWFRMQTPQTPIRRKVAQIYLRATAATF